MSALLVLRYSSISVLMQHFSSSYQSLSVGLHRFERTTAFRETPLKRQTLIESAAGQGKGQTRTRVCDRIDPRALSVGAKQYRNGRKETDRCWYPT